MWLGRGCRCWCPKARKWCRQCSAGLRIWKIMSGDISEPRPRSWRRAIYIKFPATGIIIRTVCSFLGMKRWIKKYLPCALWLVLSSIMCIRRHSILTGICRCVMGRPPRFLGMRIRGKCMALPGCASLPSPKGIWWSGRIRW